MIKTKSIFEDRSLEDGTRICVMRYARGSYDYDEWLQRLAPFSTLLANYKNLFTCTWDKFKNLYLKQMEQQVGLIKSLKTRSDNGEVITLLCWEKDDRYCHRSLLKTLIEES